MNWTVQMEYSRDGASDICFPGREDGAKPRPPEAAVPVEQLLVAVASCFAQSCHIVLGARGEEPSDIRIRVIGEKAGTPPNRLERIDLTCELIGIAPEQAARIKRDAKRICTVTNTLGCELVVAE